MEKLSSFFVFFWFGLHSCGLGWVRVIVLWVGLGTGYSLVGWVGYGVNIILVLV